MHSIKNTGAIDYSFKIVSGYEKQDILFFDIKESGAKSNVTIDTILESCHKTLKIDIITTLKYLSEKPSYIYLSNPSVILSAYPSKPVPSLSAIHKPTP